MWLVPRQTVNGKLDPMVERMDAKIAKLKEQESQGLIKPTRKDDILAMALGKDEHPGRVRCVGLGASSKQYFGENKRRCVRASQQEVEGLKGQVTKLQSQVDFLQKMIMDMQGWVSEVEHNHRSRHDSCSLKESCSDAEPNKGEWTKCELYWPDLTIMVAKGRVFIPESGSYIILHGKDLDSKTLKVTMDTVISSQEHANVPYSTEEVSCIEDAIGGFIAWLKDMVIYGLDCDTSKGTNISASKPSQCKNVCLEHAQSQQSDVISRVSSILASIDKLDILISMPANVLQLEHFLHIGKRELNVWLQGQKLEAMHVALYMRKFSLAYRYGP